jgi:hypothetical protein
MGLAPGLHLRPAKVSMVGVMRHRAGRFRARRLLVGAAGAGVAALVGAAGAVVAAEWLRLHHETSDLERLSASAGDAPALRVNGRPRRVARPRTT